MVVASSDVTHRASGGQVWRCRERGDGEWVRGSCRDMERWGYQGRRGKGRSILTYTCPSAYEESGAHVVSPNSNKRFSDKRKLSGMFGWDSRLFLLIIGF